MFRYGCLLVLLLAAGCGRSDLPPMAPVSGVVTLDGAPLPGAEVQFVPDSGPPALGYSDAGGRYELTTAGRKGAVVGHHRVRVEARRPPRDETDTLPERLTPQRYADPETSGLTADVKAGQTNTIDLPLSSSPE